MKKTILILGGLGFIGYNLLEEMIAKKNYNIIVFDFNRAKYINSEIKRKARIYYGHFGKQSDIEAIFKKYKIDIVIHMIWTSLPTSTDYEEDIRFNLLNSVNLLELLIKNSIKKLIFISSGGTIYGIQKKIPISEKACTDPISFYGISKLAMEKYIQLYHYLYGLNYLILRISNPYGRYHYSSTQGLINVILSKILKNEKVSIWGDGSISRDYIYMNDVTRIIDELLGKNINNEIINIGSGKGYTVNQILDIVRKTIGDFPLEYLPTRKADVPSVVLDIKKLKRILDPGLTDIRTGIINTFKWMEKNEKQ